MKKKFLSFILAICLILPCIFVFSACNDEPTDKSLAGKTICCSKLYSGSDRYEKIDFGSEISLGFIDKENGWIDYRLEMSIGELLEFCLGTEAITYPNNAQPTTLEEAQDLFIEKIENKFFDMAYNPYVTFSEDLTTATIYYETGVPSKTYDVECVKDGLSYSYTLKYENTECVRFNSVDSNNEDFYASPITDTELGEQYNFIKTWVNLTLDGECAKTVELVEYNNPNNKITRRLDEIFGDDIELSVSLIYSIQK